MEPATPSDAPPRDPLNTTGDTPRLSFPRAAARLGWSVVGSRYVLAAVAFVAYAAGMRGLLRSQAPQLLTEGPLLLSAYHLSWLALRAGRVRAVRAMIAAFPFAVLYGCHDYWFYVFGSVPDWGDVSLIVELGRFDWSGGITVAVVLTCVPLGVWLAALDVRAPARLLTRRPRLLDVGVALAVGFCVGLVLFAPRAVSWAGGRLSRNQFDASVDAARYGRVFMALVRDADRRAVTRLTDYRAPAEVGLALEPEVAAAIQRRNVHVIMMESFVDPVRFRALHFDRDPFHERLRALTGDALNTSLAPGVGTGTARAEFEVLCGQPSLKLAGPVEFQVFSGAPTPCLPALLVSLGWVTQSSFPGSPRFYNAVRAYRSVGFQQSLFGGDSIHTGGAAIAPSGWEGDLFDGFLFEQNRAYLASRPDAGAPVFNYVLTMYGHTPFRRDLAHQPDVLHTGGVGDWEVNAIANQAWYRTEALADHLDKLRQMDPESLVVAIGDHLPPSTLWGFSIYLRLGYIDGQDGIEKLRETALLVMDRGVMVKLPATVSHFDVPGIILDRLTGGVYCSKPGRCHFGGVTSEHDRLREHLEPYKTLVGLGMRPLDEAAARPTR